MGAVEMPPQMFLQFHLRGELFLSINQLLDWNASHVIVLKVLMLAMTTSCLLMNLFSLHAVDMWRLL